MRQKLRACFGVFVVLFLLAVSSPAFASGAPMAIPPTPRAASPELPPTMTAQADIPAAQNPVGLAYVLGVGDRVRLTVYGEEDLSGEYEVSSTGIIAVPLIGEIRAANGTLQAFEEAVRQKLKSGYLNDPKVGAQVVNYRPFFILGEVARPGSYPYVNGMNVLNAVAMAGGYTYRADKSGVTVVHASDPSKKEYAVAEEAPVLPGDILRVSERFF